MALTFSNISHAYGATRAVTNVSFHVPKGQVTCLLGPSGCGKSTLLKLAAGLLSIQAGRIELDGEDFASVHSSPPPEDRPVGLVFQDGALFPHLSVADNVAFGLRARRGRRAKPSRFDIGRRVEALLEQVDLKGLDVRFPHELSGGQKQRVALARALAPQPAVLLMDEPYANIDIVLRRRLRAETRQLLRQQHATVLLVTHDPDEAMEMADHIVIMDAGRVQQAGPPIDIYTDPLTISVGTLFGGGQSVAGQVQSGSVLTDFGAFNIRDVRVMGVAKLSEGADTHMLFRPDCATVEHDLSSPLIISDIRLLGHRLRACVTHPAGQSVWVELDSRLDFEIGQSVSLRPKRDRLYLFPA